MSGAGSIPWSEYDATRPPARFMFGLAHTARASARRRCRARPCAAFFVWRLCAREALLLFKIGLLFSSARLIRSAVHIVSRPADADQTPYCPVVAALKEHWYVVCAWDAAHNIVYVLEEKLLDN